MFLRNLLFVLSPGLRRTFYFDPMLLMVVAAASVALIINTNVRKLSLATGMFMLLLISVFSALYGHERYLKYLPMVLLFFVFTPNMDFDNKKLKRRLRLLTVVALFFGLISILSNHYGHVPTDLRYLESGYGSISIAGHINSSDIRPFFPFSGVPEATFFYLVCSGIFWMYNRKMISLFCLLVGIISGSRGILIAFAISVLLAGFFPKRNSWHVFVQSFALGTITFLFFVFSEQFLRGVEVLMGGNRLFHYGTMDGRIYFIAVFADMLEFKHIVMPVLLDRNIFDNMMVTLINDFGFLWASLILFAVFRVLYIQDRFSQICLGTLLIFCFFADTFLSLFLIFTYVLAAHFKRKDSV